MSDEPKRSWREVAAELTAETDTSRVLALCEELNAALEEQLKSPPRSMASGTGRHLEPNTSS